MGTHLPILLGGVKVVQEAAEHLLLGPLPAPHLGVSAATVNPLEVIHGHHAVPISVQLGERSCNDFFPGLGHGGLGRGSGNWGTPTPPGIECRTQGIPEQVPHSDEFLGVPCLHADTQAY